MQPRILVPYDFGPASSKALSWAADLQRSTNGAPVHVIHVVNPLPSVALPEMSAFPGPTEAEIVALQRELERDVQKLGVAATVEVVRAPWVPVAILDAARSLEADVIVMGTHGRAGFPRLMLGSTAEYVLRHATCPVVTVRSERPQAARAA
jgi:nucleotide-binding universal stress UspA family protein